MDPCYRLPKCLGNVSVRLAQEKISELRLNALHFVISFLSSSAEMPLDRVASSVRVVLLKSVPVFSSPIMNSESTCLVLSMISEFSFHYLTVVGSEAGRK